MATRDERRLNKKGKIEINLKGKTKDIGEYVKENKLFILLEGRKT